MRGAQPLSRGEGAPKGGGSGMRATKLNMVRRTRRSKTESVSKPLPVPPVRLSPAFHFRLQNSQSSGYFESTFSPGLRPQARFGAQPPKAALSAEMKGLRLRHLPCRAINYIPFIVKNAKSAADRPRILQQEKRRGKNEKEDCELFIFIVPGNCEEKKGVNIKFL